VFRNAPVCRESRMAEHGITNLAQFYTSEFKYSKAKFERISDEVIGPQFARSGMHMPPAATTTTSSSDNTVAAADGEVPAEAADAAQKD
jgi:hypothetical protein